MADLYAGAASTAVTGGTDSEIDRGRLAGVLCRLHRERFSGVLHVESGERTAMVGFRAGVPVSFDDASPGQGLGELLVERGDLTHEQYAEVINRVTDGLVENEVLAFCQHAVQLGYLTAEQTQTELSERIRTGLIATLAWTACRTMLDSDPELLSGHAEYPQALGEIVYMGVRTFYDDALLRSYCPDPGGSYLRLRASPANIGHFFGLDDDEFRVLRRVDPEAPIAGLIDSADVDQSHVLALLALLRMAAFCDIASVPFSQLPEPERSGMRRAPSPPRGTAVPVVRPRSQTAMAAVNAEAQASRSPSQSAMAAAHSEPYSMRGTSEATAPTRSASQSAMPAANPQPQARDAAAPARPGSQSPTPGASSERYSLRGGSEDLGARRSGSQSGMAAIPASAGQQPTAAARRGSQSGMAAIPASTGQQPTAATRRSGSQSNMAAVPASMGQQPTAATRRSGSQSGMAALPASALPQPTAAMPSTSQDKPATAADAAAAPDPQEVAARAARSARRAMAATKRLRPPGSTAEHGDNVPTGIVVQPGGPLGAAGARSISPAAAGRSMSPGAVGGQSMPPRTAGAHDSEQADYARAHLQELLKRKRQAQAPAEPATPAKYEPVRNLRHAQELLRDQHYARAEEVLRELAAQDPQSDVLRAYHLWSRMRAEPAPDESHAGELTDLAKKLVQTPEHTAFASYVLGHIYLAAKKDDLAEKYFRRAHAADRGHKDAERHLLILERRKQQAADGDAAGTRKIFGIQISQPKPPKG